MPPRMAPPSFMQVRAVRWVEIVRGKKETPNAVTDHWCSWDEVALPLKETSIIAEPFTEWHIITCRWEGFGQETKKKYGQKFMSCIYRHREPNTVEFRWGNLIGTNLLKLHSRMRLQISGGAWVTTEYVWFALSLLYRGKSSSIQILGLVPF